MSKNDLAPGPGACLHGAISKFHAWHLLPRLPFALSAVKCTETVRSQPVRQGNAEVDARTMREMRCNVLPLGSRRLPRDHEGLTLHLLLHRAVVPPETIRNQSSPAPAGGLEMLTRVHVTGDRSLFLASEANLVRRPMTPSNSIAASRNRGGSLMSRRWRKGR